MDDEINLIEYWRVIVKWKWLIIGLVIICALFSFISNARQPKIYRATTTLMIVDSGGGGLASALASIPFLAGSSGGGGGENKLIPILQSNALAQQVARNIDKQKYFPLICSNDKLDEKQKEAIIAGSLRGAIEAKTQMLFEVSITWKDPDQAAELANIYVVQLSQFLNANGLNINFRVIDPATPSSTPINKDTNSKVIMAAGIGFIIGALLAFLLEFIGNLPRKND